MTQVLPDIRPTETYTESNFLRVHTFAERGNPANRLATIEHLYYGPDQHDQSKFSWGCETVVDSEPMSQEDALFIARSYAAERSIPVIYECHSDD